MSKVELNIEDMELVAGGDITYTWDGEKGTIGINGNNPFILVDKKGFVDYMNEVHGTMTDAEILSNLLEMGVIKKR